MLIFLQNHIGEVETINLHRPMDTRLEGVSILFIIFKFYEYISFILKALIYIKVVSRVDALKNIRFNFYLLKG